jgi:hypothetical protein
VADNDDLKAVMLRLKEAGNRGLSRELNKGITKAITPLKTELPKSALRTLPRRGGLAKRVAESKVSVRKRQYQVTLVLKNAYHLEKMDDPGVLRRPVFPKRTRFQRAVGARAGKAKLQQNRKKWAWESQRIRPGWFTRPTNAAKAQAKADIEQAIQNVVRQIEGH